LLSTFRKEDHGEELREEATHSCVQEQETNGEKTFQEQSREAQNDLASQPD